MSHQDRFYEKYVSTHAGTIHGIPSKAAIEAQFPAWNAYFGKFLPESSRSKILDLGCGDGGFVSWLNAMGYIDVQGIDYSEEQVAVAISYGFENVRHADAFEFLQKNMNTFDVVFATDVLEHIPKENILKLVEYIFDALKPGGMLITQTVNAESLMWGRLRHGDFTHETAFTCTSIKQVFRLAGFKTANVYSLRPYVHGFISLFRYCLWRMFELVFHFYLAVSTGAPAGIFTQNLVVVAKKT